MLKSRLRPFPVIVFSALLGLAVGVVFSHWRSGKPWQQVPAGGIKVLAIKGLLSRELLNEFQSESNISVELTEVDSPRALNQHLPETYDVVNVFSFQVEEAFRHKWISKLPSDVLPVSTRVSPDFLYLGEKRTLRGLVPVLWGVSGFMYHAKKLTDPPQLTEKIAKDIRLKGHAGFVSSSLPFIEPSQSQALLSSSVVLNRPSDSTWLAYANHGELAFEPYNDGIWQFVFPEDAARLWVLAFALGQRTTQGSAAIRFLEFVLEPTTGIQLIQNSHQASTFRNLDPSKIDERLTPSYLRQIPVSRLQLAGYIRDDKGSDVRTLEEPMFEVSEDGSDLKRESVKGRRQ